MEKPKLVISSSPHIRSEESIEKIMYTVLACLSPAAVLGVVFFGWHALLIEIVCVVTALATEALFQKARGKPITIGDGSAAITGLLLALVLPPSLPLWMAALGAFVAIGLGKQLFGGLGHNIFNPALVGRAFLMAAFPVQMTTWKNAFWWKNPDAVTSATPLALVKFAKDIPVKELVTPALKLKLLLGNVGGCIGETSAIALLVGAVVLLAKRYINWRVPVSILGTVFVLTGLLWLVNPDKFADPVFHLLSGGLILGAFYMATDMVTSPLTPVGNWIFGVGIGGLVVLIRVKGGLPEGVMYSILLMNALTPLINRYTRPRIFGEVAK